MENQEVFIFCWYPDGYNPRAVIVDIEKLDQSAEDQMMKMLSVGNVVEAVEEKFDFRYKDDGSLRGYTSKVVGYRSSKNEDLVNDEETSLLFNTWVTIADSHERMLGDCEWIKYSSEYYINDSNCNLSPIELHEKLSSLTYNPQCPDHKFVVKHCILLSDVPLNFVQELKPLRFFIKLKDDTLTTSHIKEKLKDKFDSDNIILSSASYGYLKPKTIKQWEELNDNSFDLDFALVIFA